MKEVRVIDEAAEEMKIQELGIEGGKYLRSILKKDDIIGFSRGRNTSALVEYLPEADEYPENITVTQLMGGSIETEGNVPVDETVYRLATKMHTFCDFFLSKPFFIIIVRNSPVFLFLLVWITVILN